MTDFFERFIENIKPQIVQKKSPHWPPQKNREEQRRLKKEDEKILILKGQIQARILLRMRHLQPICFTKSMLFVVIS